MSETLFAIAGIIFGAICTGLVSLTLGRRKEKQDVKAALRLLCTDLHKTRAIIKKARDNGDFSEENQELPVRAFIKHADTAAKFLASMEWKRVEGSVLGIEQLECIRRDVTAEERQLTPKELACFERIDKYIDQTINILDKEISSIDHSDGYQLELWRN